MMVNSPEVLAQVTRAFLDLLHAAELPLRRMARLVGAHAMLFVFRRLQLEMRAHLLGHVGVEFFLPEQRAEFAERPHGAGCRASVWLTPGFKSGLEIWRRQPD